MKKFEEFDKQHKNFERASKIQKKIASAGNRTRDLLHTMLSQVLTLEESSRARSRGFNS